LVSIIIPVAILVNLKMQWANK